MQAFLAADPMDVSLCTHMAAAQKLLDDRNRAIFRRFEHFLSPPGLKFVCQDISEDTEGNRALRVHLTNLAMTLLVIDQKVPMLDLLPLTIIDKSYHDLFRVPEHAPKRSSGQRFVGVVRKDKVSTELQDAILKAQK
jgi:hypothetical protein